MKSFLYKVKGALALTLAMSMFSPQVFAAEALSAEEQGVQAAPAKTEEEFAAEVLPTLTYEDALLKAKKHSYTLKDLEEEADVLQDERWDLYDKIGSIKAPEYDYQRWVSFTTWMHQAQRFQAEMGLESNTLNKELQNLILEVGVKNSFVSILGMEDSIVLAEKNAEMQQKLYEQARVKHRLGMLSTYGTGGLEEKRIAAEQAKNDYELAQAALTQAYADFNALMGENMDQRYELVYEVAYEPYEMQQTMSQYITDKINNDDLTIKLMELGVEGAKFTANYLPDSVPAGVTDPYLNDDRNLYNYDSAKRSLKAAKEEKETLIQNTYLTIKQLETARDSAEVNLKKAENTYRMVQLNHQAGNVTKTAVEQAEMGVIVAQNALKENAYNHDMLIFTFENPSLLG